MQASDFRRVITPLITSLIASLIASSNKPVVRRTAIGLSGVVLLYGLFGYLLLPGIIKSQVSALSAEKLQRQLSVGAVDVNPFTLDVTVRDLKLMEAHADAVFASFDTLDINLSMQSLLRLAPVIQHVRLSKPYVRIVRKDANHYNFDDILAVIASQPPSNEPARFSINNIQLENGHIDFEDMPTKKLHAVTDLTLGIPFVSSLPAYVQVFVEPLLSAKVNGTPFLLKGKARPYAETRDAVIDLNLQDLELAPYLEYLPVKPRIKMPSGRLDVKLSANFVQPEDHVPALTLSGELTLKSLQVTELNGNPVLKLPQLRAELGNTNVFGEQIDVARVSATGLEANLTRERDGALNVLSLLPPSAPAAKPAAKDAAPPRLALGEVALRDSTLRYSDVQAAQPLQAGVEKFDIALRKVLVDTQRRTLNIGEVASGSAGFFMRQGKATPDAPQSASTADTKPVKAEDHAAPFAVNVERVAIDNWSARVEDNSQAQPLLTTISPLSVSVQGLSTVSPTPARVNLKAAVNKTGQLALNGSVALAPLQADLNIDAQNVDILPLQALFADQVNLRFTRANLSTSGNLQVQRAADGALTGGFKGALTLGNLAAVDQVNGNDFLRWKSLTFGGVDLRLQPLSLAMDEVALSDFFARVIIDANGSINLQDIVRHPSEEQKSLTVAASKSSKPVAPSKPLASSKPANAMPPITVRKLALQGGRVRFTDNFIRPNYSATLADFGGVVSNLSSNAASTADVDLRGEVNSAPLTVTGRINPLQKDMFLDLKAKVRGMELAPLSAYSGRYVGYGIEKGKLSFEVAYRLNQRQLNAENRLILDQLTFGNKVDSPNATTLPVQLAVALLSDRNGVIDLNLPVEGSLDDPQFSVGGLIMKVIGNLLSKAVTQPFALLSSLAGGAGGEELSTLQLDPGRSAIPASGESKLVALSKALTDRPALKLEIAGRVDPEADRDGLKRVALERKVRALKARDLSARGETVQASSVTVSTDEYPALLARAYKDENFPKPRNIVGLTKGLPVEEMEKLMMANAEIDEDDLIALGNQRAQAVKNWMTKKGGVAVERVFILATKIGNGNAKDGSPIHRVDFSLR